VLAVLISLCADEPECKSAGVVARLTGCGCVSHAERSFLSGFLPATSFHDHANQDADRLSKSLTAARVYAAQESIDRWYRFQFSDHSGERRTVVMDFGLFHSSLAVVIVEKHERRHERPLRICYDVDKSSALPVSQELVARNGNCHGKLLD
jgi:hypothetical protein